MPRRHTMRPDGLLRAPWRRRLVDDQQVPRKVREHVRPLRPQVDIVLDAHATPPRTVDPWLDRHHRSFAPTRRPPSATAAAPRAPRDPGRGRGCARTLPRIRGAQCSHERPRRHPGPACRRALATPRPRWPHVQRRRPRAARRSRPPMTTVRVTSAQYPPTTAPKSSRRKSPLATSRREVAACGSADRGPDATIDANGNPSAAFVSQRLLEEPGDLQLGHARPNLRKACACERPRRHSCRPRDAGQLVGILSSRAALDEIERRPPLPARARLEQPLKIAMHQMRRLEARHFHVAEGRQLLPETRPQTLRSRPPRAPGRRLRRRPASCTGNR